MGWIKERILSEKRKYEKSELDWSKIAEAKIKSQISKIIENKLQNIEKARDWSVDLSYPYPEVHAIWKGKQQALEELQKELNSTAIKPKEK